LECSAIEKERGNKMHTVSFDWFLSGLEWLLNLEFCLLKLLIFHQKLLWNIRSRPNFSTTFWVFRPVMRYVWSKLKLCAQKILKVAFFQKVRCVFQISKSPKKNFSKNVSWTWNLNFKLRIVFWNIFFGDLEIWKTNRTFWKKPPLVSKTSS